MSDPMTVAELLRVLANAKINWNAQVYFIGDVDPTGSVPIVGVEYSSDKVGLLQRIPEEEDNADN